MASLLPAALLLIFALSKPVATEEESDGPLVQTEQGTIRGVQGVSIRDKEFLVFLGIPYAKPPVGELRFKAPQLPDPWNETFEATQEGSNCPQIGLMSQMKEGEENCLFLNIFTNKLPADSNDLKAVMVWIHGGAFITGSATSMMFGPDHLLTEDIVFVSINYRIGVLGFLSLPEAGIPGNNGLKDQVMALRWVQKNIANFGGDPGKVTIFGQSSGAASVHFHLMSPMTTGLFHRAISQSGTGLSNWAYAEPEYMNAGAFNVGAAIGCVSTNAKDLLECFRTKPAKDFVNVSACEDETGVFQTTLKPTREEYNVNDEEVFLPGKPADLISSKKFHAVPYITGINSKEALTFLKRTEKPSFWDKFDKNFDKVVAGVAYKDVSQVKDVSEKIKKFYFGDKKPSKDTLDNFVDCFTDFDFFIGADRAVKKHAAISTAPVFYYYFQFDGELGILKKALKLKNPGVAHADELGYMFSTIISAPIEDDSDENKTLTRVVKMWTNFAKTGDPSSEMNPVLNVKWDPMTKTDPVYLDINKELAMRRDLLADRASVWNEALDPL